MSAKLDSCSNAGLEYDLEIFNIVAVSDFNMGAMEVLPDPCCLQQRACSVNQDSAQQLLLLLLPLLLLLLLLQAHLKSKRAQAGLTCGCAWPGISAESCSQNKSLNIFNSRLVLASPETATDDDYARIEGVVRCLRLLPAACRLLQGISAVSRLLEPSRAQASLATCLPSKVAGSCAPDAANTAQCPRERER